MDRLAARLGSTRRQARLATTPGATSPAKAAD